MPKKKTPTKPYSLKLVIGSDTYKSTGMDAVECLNNIEPVGYKAVGRFTLEHGGKVSEARMFSMKLKRIFGNEIDKALFAKRLTTLL
jgi:hypothetical protein